MLLKKVEMSCFSTSPCISNLETFHELYKLLFYLAYRIFISNFFELYFASDGNWIHPCWWL